MKKAKRWLGVWLTLCMIILTVSIPALAELFVQGEEVYDTDQNVYWTLDANLLNTLAGTTTASYNALIADIIAANKGGIVVDTPNYFTGGSNKYTLTSADFAQGGFADYWGAIGFVNYLNSIRYSGSNQWSLPEVRSGSLGYSRTENAYGALFYNELGGIATKAMPSGPFLNVQTAVDDSGDYSAYWYSSSYAPNPNYAWNLCSSNGLQWFSRKDFMMYVWPVRSGPSHCRTH